MSTTPPDEPGTPGPTPPSGPDYGAPASGPDYGAPPPPSGGYGTPPPGGPYGAPPPPSNGGYGAAGDQWSVGNAIGYGWTKFTQNVGSILLFTLLLLVGSIVLSIVGSILDRAFFGTSGNGIVRETTHNIFSSLLGFVGQAFFGAAVIRAALDITEGRGLDIGAVFRRINFGPVLVLAILIAIIETVGFILLIIPGLIALLLLYFATYFLLDRDLGPVEAITSSVKLVVNDLGKALIWAIVAFIVTVVGVCFCFVGLLVTIPVATIGTAYTYKKLTGQPVAP